MNLPAGAQYYEERNHNPEKTPVMVRDKKTGQRGVVTRVCPSGDHIPACAYVVYGDEDSGYRERWEPVNDLSR